MLMKCEGMDVFPKNMDRLFTPPIYGAWRAGSLPTKNDRNKEKHVFNTGKSNKIAAIIKKKA